MYQLSINGHQVGYAHRDQLMRAIEHELTHWVMKARCDRFGASGTCGLYAQEEPCTACRNADAALKAQAQAIHGDLKLPFELHLVGNSGISSRKIIAADIGQVSVDATPAFAPSVAATLTGVVEMLNELYLSRVRSRKPGKDIAKILYFVGTGHKAGQIPEDGQEFEAFDDFEDRLHDDATNALVTEFDDVFEATS